MSQWSRRAANTRLPQRNLSLPIFFEDIHEKDQNAEIKEALRSPAGFSPGGSVPIGLSCLSLKTVPVQQIVAYVHQMEYAPITQEIDYKKVFSREKLSIILDLQVNLIESIPSDVFSIPNIKGLFLRSNRLETLSPQIRKLKDLAALTLANNPIKYLPIEILSLPLGQFTITPKHFLSASCMEERNQKISFAASKTLSEMCLKNLSLDTSSSLSFGKSLLSKYDVCSVCGNYALNTQLFFHSAHFRGEDIPFCVTLCSEGCKEKYTSALE
ncbi:hypothetical protein NECID01_0248 [Nematocida sp. AWRm77]|nr:hypothetical protein NECID01_0248 [Nematocida sp. AWRm77]